MVNSIGSITQNITGGISQQFVKPLTVKSAAQSTSAVAEALAETTAKVSETLFSAGAQTAAKTAQTVAKRSFLSKTLRVLSGEFADDVAVAFKNRKKIPFKEGFKSSFCAGTAAAEGVKKSGFLGKIGGALTKVFPFLKHSKIAAAGSFLSRNSSVLTAYAIAAFPVYKAFKNYGASEGLKETLKFGISTACIIASEALIAVLSVYTGGLAGLLKFAAPIAGASLGNWLGNKILGKSIEQKKEEAIAAKHTEQLQELLQNPKIAAQIQKNPEFLQQLQQDPKLTDEIYQAIKKEETEKNQQNQQNNSNNNNNNGLSLQAQTDKIREQLAKNGQITPEQQQQRDAFASQFGNPYQSTSLGTFSNLVYNVDVPFAQMVARQESMYNPFQSFMLSEQMNRDLAAHGYIFG